MDKKDIEKAIHSSINKGLSDSCHMIVLGKVLNELTGEGTFNEDSLYEIKDGKITELVINIDIED
jgi:Na+-translocating ferredoxin:NAD+ oxidoreductase RnfE subunit